ncbi:MULTISPECIES: envelope stress response membrane protein PspC [Pseudoalteromonas]|jgi:phage shock protein C|uniref:Envelope stress response membrane protein PspC n=1 Tax=Pseudoalteromonas lipolytica TaxID=570156 RepID=A0AAD0WBY1_9GAMM|nr:MULTISPECIES: envelope stress response membrane protein PspC [Pseudoalteromonas]MDX1353687.1 envelope stress response membrane protein PspC [Thiomicrorhabdus sp.]AXV64779.1 envelope stress response membrane protein PspC [Pseudoalteromonas donghaensis]EWH05990.1 phage-shock protein [Pseudoalteromonas lipolytica SCSIO 04301]MBE0351440.1 phage shock protein C [Pseudoalteromonas lipolytica LMEB 39]MCC9663001.1 envelope stress response membrane protein PspC [Pseudoalteromonas sp. MB41]|tara:strand:- start:4983 stop:5384 length:402 start_codon:yes stop_codon:yes gene_type:complete
MSTKRELFRDAERGKIAGVCAGISDYFNMELWLVRILVVTAVLLSGGPFIVVAYIAAWFILDKKPSEKTMKTGDSIHQDPLEVKFKVWQKGEPPRRALQDLKERLARVDGRLQEMERYVTSTEFTVSREINKL